MLQTAPHRFGEIPTERIAAAAAGAADTVAAAPCIAVDVAEAEERQIRHLPLEAGHRSFVRARRWTNKLSVPIDSVVHLQLVDMAVVDSVVVDIAAVAVADSVAEAALAVADC